MANGGFLYGRRISNASEERAALMEELKAIRAENAELKAELAGSVNSVQEGLQKIETSKKELIIVFLQDNDQYLDSAEYPSRTLATILSKAINQEVSHTYANRIRKELQ
jgi:septal ring factor EnvC (AmiA/AmiB activator)